MEKLKEDELYDEESFASANEIQQKMMKVHNEKAQEILMGRELLKKVHGYKISQLKKLYACPVENLLFQCEKDGEINIYVIFYDAPSQTGREVLLAKMSEWPRLVASVGDVTAMNFRMYSDQIKEALRCIDATDELFYSLAYAMEPNKWFVERGRL